jgi:CHAD domain-containing protein
MAMAYRFKRDVASVQDGVREIAGELIQDAIDRVSAQRKDVNDVVHFARKSCKKVRGLVRLIRPVFGEYEAENAAFRDAGRGLSALRDCGVLIETYDGLLEVYSDQVDRSTFAPIRRRLTAMQKELTERDDVPGMLQTFERVMTRARKRAHRWVIETDGFNALEPGLRKSYKAARRAMDAAAKDPTADNFHEWRKRVKDHWYHSRLLWPVWQKPMKVHGEVADELGDILGRHHDLEVFRQKLTERQLGEASALEVLAGLAGRRQKTLEEEAFSIGARLLAEPAGSVAVRWRSYWDTWRMDSPRDAALAA